MKVLTSRQVNAITEGVKRGLTAQVIAEAVDCSVSSVHRYKPYSLWSYRRGETTEARQLVQRLQTRVTLLRRAI